MSETRIQRVAAEKPGLRTVWERIATRVGVRTEATEAAYFEVLQDRGSFRIDCLAHIRGGSSTAQERESAIHRMRQFIEGVLTSGNEGALPLDLPVGSAKWYALVAVSKIYGSPRRALLTIVLCSNIDDAMARYSKLREVADAIEQTWAGGAEKKIDGDIKN